MKRTSYILLILLFSSLVLSACGENTATAVPLTAAGNPAVTTAPTSTEKPVSPASSKSSPKTEQATTTATPPARPTPGPDGSEQPGPNGATNNQYSLEQAMSDNAQLSTIAFSGLAFITGSSGADSFFPPGKVADFFGFQYMRDVDTAGYGHNTTFLTRVANNVLYILNDEQKAKLLALAKTQAPLYTNFAYNRFPLMNAFRRNLEGQIPAGATGLSTQAVAGYTAGLYKIDADLSYNRSVVVGGIINSFTAEQKAYLAKMQFNNYLSWPEVAEDENLKKNISDNEFVAIMTYASELFSWYKGGLEADVYYCPERHGTYFGGFYMKDYPAMNNPDYFISTATTGDSGKAFLEILNSDQRALITGIIEAQRAHLAEIAQIRTTVSTELRKAMTGGTVDKAKVYSLIERYGVLDGQMSALYATRFAAVSKTLTETQRAALVKLRNLDVVPQGAYRFSTPVAMPTIPNTDFLFGVGSAPQNAGQTTAPQAFGATNEPPSGGQPGNDKPSTGTIESYNPATKVLVVKGSNGSSQSYDLTGARIDKITKIDQAGLSKALAAGGAVEVTGQKGSDGSYTATRLVVRNQPPKNGNGGSGNQPPATQGSGNQPAPGNPGNPAGLVTVLNGVVSGNKLSGKDASGQAVTVILSASTLIYQQTTGTFDDLKTGKSVTVNAKKSQDSSQGAVVTVEQS